MILSTLSTTSIEDVAAAGGPSAHRWFQLYIGKDRAFTEQLVRRAEAAGFSAIALTVDCAAWGQRYQDARNKFSLPSHLRCAYRTASSSEHIGRHSGEVEREGVKFRCRLLKAQRK